ncbi:MAG: STAS/SEC14 domain-containing protein [Myxococcaceae bacterium]|nr:STAS/SEC14 domain-containing protein [Myxococcaceae bacterium]
MRTASGHRVLRSVYEGDITVEDARRFVEQVKPGGPYDHHGHLVLGKMLEVSTDVRKILSSQKPLHADNPIPVALVVPSALLRMVVSLVLRASENPNTDFFKDEASALAWLDGALTRYEQKRK